MGSIATNQFVHKYAPSFDKVVALDRVKEHFPNGMITKHLLLYGSSGLGKSSIAKSLKDKYNYLYINTRTHGGVTSLRENGDIYNHCAETSFDDRPKLVFLDEIDGASDDFFEALNGFMDVFVTTLFVATTNHVGKIPKAMTSRFCCVNFDFASPDEEKEFFIGYRNRLFLIAKAEGITSTKESIGDFSKRYFPDFRKGLQALQTAKDNNVTDLASALKEEFSFSHSELYDLILSGRSAEDQNTTLEIHRLTTSISDPVSAISRIDKEFFDYVVAKKPTHITKCGNAIINICKHSDMISNRVDPLLVLKSLVFSLCGCMR